MERLATQDQWMRVLHELDRATWSLAAVVSALRDGEPTAKSVLEVLDLAPSSNRDDGAEDDMQRSLAAAAAAPLLQASRFVLGGSTWDLQDDEALLAQGRASAAAGRIFPEKVLPQLPEGDRLLTKPVSMLDVGVGVAAMAVALCQNMPNLSIVGLDVLTQALELARRSVDEAGLTDRIHLRLLDVSDLAESSAFDLAWVPAPFIPPAPLEAGLRRVNRALKPGAWVLLGHGRYGRSLYDDAVNRFKTVAYGGTALDDHEAAALLRTTGFVDVGHLDTPDGVPAFAAGRRPMSG